MRKAWHTSRVKEGRGFQSRLLGNAPAMCFLMSLRGRQQGGLGERGRGAGGRSHTMQRLPAASALPASAAAAPADLCHCSHSLCHEEQVVDDVLRLSGKLGAQHGVLRQGRECGEGCWLRRSSKGALATLMRVKAPFPRRCWHTWVAMPTGQVFVWHFRIMMQPRAISGAVANPNSSAPSRAATAMSRPVFMPPSACAAAYAGQRISRGV
jgi:hypothetical protein